jgi:hypothetical protein
MKRIYFVLLLAVILFYGCRSNKPLTENSTQMETPEAVSPIANYHDASTWLLGYFQRDMMVKAPHCQWFLTGYDEYKFNESAVKKLTEMNKEELTVKIVMGSWCPDSRREVPRFMKVLDSCSFPASGITYIGVDEDKISPVGEYSKLNIQRVPTFIFYKKNIEVGRIIENPVTSLEQDMVDILTRE